MTKMVIGLASFATFSFFSDAALANCRDFITAQRYSVRSETVSGPTDIGRIQNWALIVEDVAYLDQNCKSFNGQYAPTGGDGPWSVSGTACKNQLTITMRRSRTGEKDYHWISESCSYNSSTGTSGYTDAAGQRWSYEWRMRPN